MTTEIVGYAETLIGRGTGAILYEEVDGRKTRWQFRDRRNPPHRGVNPPRTAISPGRST